MSDALVWELLKDHHALLIKRGKFTFSRERGNLRNIHSQRYSGLANRKTVDVTMEKKAIHVTTTDEKHFQSPASSRVATPVRGMKALKHFVSSKFIGYRSDLQYDALARASSLKRALKSKDAHAKK